MTILTTEQRLTAVQTAISDILKNGQSYALGNRELTKADLKTLLSQEKILMSQYNCETYGRAVNYVRFD